ncbi:hypothetical protein [Streptomyces sp. NBC_01565]|uniref:hypothetical protein n=1 Tax=Streptomyces sp. NBC_01565 TaxID=2975881 RepID=UPI0022539BB3|nr:hypothetical protein [Streptomyces sp. NBC_01565]MCX4546707.1 hypothetical protein [Streptomyces sp. NBC_01565]
MPDEDGVVTPETCFLNNVFGGSAWGGEPGTFGKHGYTGMDTSVFSQLFGRSDGPAVARVLDDTDASEQGLRAVVFTQAEFKGESQSLAPGRYDIGDLTLPNDSISSVIVSKGLKVALFEHGGFTGAAAVINSDTGAFGADLRSKVSSVIVEKV